MTIVVLFKRKGRSYRMRAARVHLHPGECDRFEVAGRDLMGEVAWAPLPDGSHHEVPSGEWLTRRALWRLVEGRACSTGSNLVVIDLGEA